MSHHRQPHADHRVAQGLGHHRLLLDPDPDLQEGHEDQERGARGHGGLLVQGGQWIREYPSQSRSHRDR